MKKLLKIEVKNFKAIKDFAVEFTSDSNIWLVRADNDNGKSSLLTAIIALITGKADIPEPVMKGEEFAVIKGLFSDEKGGNYTIEQFFKTGQKAVMTMTLPNGVRTSRLSDLRGLFNYTDLDITKFIELGETVPGRREQIETVKKLLSEKAVMEVNIIDAEKLQMEAARKIVGQQLEGAKAVSTKLFVAPSEQEAYKKKKEVSELTKKQTTAQEEVSKQATYAEEIKTKKEEFEKYEAIDIEVKAKLKEDKKKEKQAQIDALQKQIDTLTKERDTMDEQFEKYKKDLSDAKVELNKEIKVLTDKISDEPQKDLNEINKEIATIGEFNAKVERVVEYEKAVKEKEEYDKQYNEMTEKIKGMRKRYEEVIKSGGIPVKGLSFDEDGLTYNGVPFRKEQISESELMLIGAQLLINLNPETKIFRMSQGESLGAKKLDTLASFAKTNKFMGFVERVETGKDELTVTIYEDFIEEAKKKK